MSLEKYTAKHLFLVMGTNPLPNFIAAKLLARKDSQIYLIHSKDVGEFCKNLENLLKNNGFGNLIYIEVDESNGDDIFKKISSICQNRHLSDVGLNYTGGTKAMAVHSYLAMKEIVPDAYFYYLDPREMVFMIEKNGSVRKTECLRDEIQVSITQMVNLHGYILNEQKKNQIYESPQHPEIAERMGKGLDFFKFRSWCSANLRGVEPIEGDNNNESEEKITNKKDVRITEFKINKNNPNTGQEILLPNFKDYTKTIWMGCTTLGDLAEKIQTSSSSLVDYLDGLWLEDYVLVCMKHIAEKSIPGRLNCGRNLNAKKEIPGTNRQRTFQLDDYAIIGYQLFGISCGSATDKGELKKKLFEVMLRSTQIGGEEARYALVCNYSNPEIIEDDVNNTWDTKGNLRVFGAKDLPKLEVKMLEWFNNQPGGPL